MSRDKNSDRKLGLRLAAGAVVVAMLAAGAAFAQSDLPEHQPGTICVTPTFWCWLSEPVPVGSICSCTSPQGPVGGRAA